MSEQKSYPCRDCNGMKYYETRKETVTYRNHSRAIEILGWWCDDCGDADLDFPALNALEKAFLELKAEVDSLPLNKLILKE